MEVLRKDRPSLEAPSLLAFCVGGLRGEFTEVVKIYIHGKHVKGGWAMNGLGWVVRTSLSSSVSSIVCMGCMLPSLSQHWSTPLWPSLPRSSLRPHDAPEAPFVAWGSQEPMYRCESPSLISLVSLCDWKSCTSWSRE